MAERDGFELTPEQARLTSCFKVAAASLCLSHAEGLKALGLSEAEADTVLVNVLIGTAARSACRVRRELLHDERQYERWRAVTDEAFKRAVELPDPVWIGVDMAVVDRPEGGDADPA